MLHVFLNAISSHGLNKHFQSQNKYVTNDTRVNSDVLHVESDAIAFALGSVGG
jgi:hypothetical protein